MSRLTCWACTMAGKGSVSAMPREAAASLRCSARCSIRAWVKGDNAGLKGIFLISIRSVVGNCVSFLFGIKRTRQEKPEWVLETFLNFLLARLERSGQQRRRGISGKGGYRCRQARPDAGSCSAGSARGPRVCATR
ncbi:hypothetical protein FQZ97_1162790 [compost metagenome]